MLPVYTAAAVAKAITQLPFRELERIARAIDDQFAATLSHLRLIQAAERIVEEDGNATHQLTPSEEILQKEYEAWEASQGEVGKDEIPPW